MKESYIFSSGEEIFGFTPSVFSTTILGTLCVPTVVKRSEIQLTENVVKGQVNFSFLRINSFAKRCLETLFEDSVFVIIYKNSTSFWQGRLLSSSLQGNYIILTCDSGEKSTSRIPSGAKFSEHCWKILYSANCGVNKENFKSTYTIVSVSGLEIFFPITEVDNYFFGGIVEFAGQKRRITFQTSTGIKISEKFTGITPSGLIDLYPYCNLTGVGCSAFGNLINFGGFEYIPFKNPMDKTGLL